MRDKALLCVRISETSIKINNKPIIKLLFYQLITNSDERKASSIHDSALNYKI